VKALWFIIYLIRLTWFQTFDLFFFFYVSLCKAARQGYGKTSRRGQEGCQDFCRFICWLIFVLIVLEMEGRRVYTTCCTGHFPWITYIALSNRCDIPHDVAWYLVSVNCAFVPWVMLDQCNYILSLSFAKLAVHPVFPWLEQIWMDCSTHVVQLYDAQLVFRCSYFSSAVCLTYQRCAVLLIWVI